MGEMSRVQRDSYKTMCSKLFAEPDIRFAGIVDEDGDLIAGGQREGLVPLESSESLKAFMRFVAKVSIRKDFDESLGPINYLAARRDKIVLISFPFPISRVLLLVSAEPSVNIENLAQTVVDTFEEV